MTALRQRMIDAMVLRGFRPRTQVSYLRAVSRMALHYHRSPELITDQEVQAYLLHLVRDRQLARTSRRQPGLLRHALPDLRGAGAGRPALAHPHGADAAAPARGVVPRRGGGRAGRTVVPQGPDPVDDGLFHWDARE